MLALLLASVICVQPGIVTQVDVDVPAVMITPGPFHSEDPSIANVSGGVAVRQSRGALTVEGVAEGQTRLLLSFFSGWGSYRVVVGSIVVDEPVTVTAASEAAVVPEGTEVTLTATTSGNVNVVWYDGETYLGIGHSIRVTLPRGTHRLTAQAWNDCGTVTSNELRIDVVSPRRHATRH